MPQGLRLLRHDTILTNDHSSIALEIKSVTRFPLEGEVEYVVSPSDTKTFTLNFRVPGWSQNFVAKIGDKTYKGTAGAWKAGDKVVISFDMPVQVIPGGISYPNKIAFKRGPQVLAIDQALNNEAGPLRNLQFMSDSVSLVDAKEKLPSDWSWKQAYAAELKTSQQSKQVLLVPYSEAGQKGTNLRSGLTLQYSDQIKFYSKSILL